MALLVTVGTDGFTDWIQIPSGERLNLGSLSVLRLITKAAPSKRAAGAALAEFLREGEVVVGLDQDLMWSLLEPKRSRWAGVSLMGSRDQETHPMKNLANLEQHVEALNRAAANRIPAEKMAEGHDILFKLAQKLPVKISSEEADDDSDEAQEKQAVEKVATDHPLAQAILEKAEETVAAIDRLAAAGRPFRADRARADVYEVTSRVASVLDGSADLVGARGRSAAWHSARLDDEFSKLAARMDQIHGLFFGS